MNITDIIRTILNIGIIAGLILFSLVNRRRKASRLLFLFAVGLLVLRLASVYMSIMFRRELLTFNLITLALILVYLLLESKRYVSHGWSDSSAVWRGQEKHIRRPQRGFLKALVSSFRNYWGNLNGYSGCGICGDRWNWKEEHRIHLPGDRGVFPYCEECHLTASKEQKHEAIEGLWDLWGPRMRLEDGIRIEEAHRVVYEEI